MLWIQWMNVVLLAGLISYSYGYHQRRRTRETPVKETAKKLVQKMLQDEAAMEAQTKDALRKDEHDIQANTQTIFLAVQKIAEAGVRDVANAQQWASIQSAIRNGITVIIRAYQRYNNLHRETCQSIENFTISMINKYETELAALNKLTLPNIPSGNVENNSSAINNFMTQLLNILMYAKIHENTLARALDAIADRTHELSAKRTAETNVQTHTVNIELRSLTDAFIPNQPVTFSCGSLSENNACAACPLSIAATSGQWLENACTNACYPSEYIT